MIDEDIRLNYQYRNTRTLKLLWDLPYYEIISLP